VEERAGRAPQIFHLGTGSIGLVKMFALSLTDTVPNYLDVYFD